MKSFWIRGPLKVAALGLIVGCAATANDAGFEEVHQMTHRWGGPHVKWRGRTAEDADVDAAVRRLLQKELTIDDATQIALLNNRRLQATFEELGIAQADLVQAGLLKNPVFSAELRFPGKAMEIDVFQEIMELLLLPLRKRVAESQFAAAKLRVADAVFNTWNETRSAFYTLQAAEQSLELRRSIVQATQAAADAARKLHDAGNTNDLDFANDQAMYEQSKVELSQAEAEALDARERLNALMGLWGEDTERWSVATHLPDLPQPEVASVGLESLAVSRRLDLAAARQDIEALARSAGFTHFAAWVPEINLGLHNEREPSGLNTIGPSIELPLPLFDQGQAKLERFESQLRQARQKYLALAVEIRAAVRAAHNRMLSARSRADNYLRVILPLRQQIVDQTQLQYNSMLTGIFQLLQARQGQIEAGQAYVLALRDYWMARAELEKATGGMLKTDDAAMTTATQPLDPPSESQHQHPHGD